MISGGLCGSDEMNDAGDDEGADKGSDQIGNDTELKQAVEVLGVAEIRDHEMAEDKTAKTDDSKAQHSRPALGCDNPRREKTGDKADHQAQHGV